MLPDVTYILRFVHRDGNIELFEHADRELAWSHFDSFGSDDADIYSEIQIIRRDWRTDEDKVLKTNVLVEV